MMTDGHFRKAPAGGADTKDDANGAVDGAQLNIGGAGNAQERKQDCRHSQNPQIIVPIPGTNRALRERERERERWMDGWFTSVETKMSIRAAILSSYIWEKSRINKAPSAF